MIIRPAVVSDAVSGASCHLACWQESYADIVTRERLAALTSRDMTLTRAGGSADERAFRCLLRRS
jgi:hypothetical protein